MYAPTSPPEETAHPQAAPLITGHFRETAGYASWRTRGTDDWLLIETLAGRGRFGQKGREDLYAAAGDIVLLQPGTRHDYGVAPGADGWEILWAHFHPRAHWHEWLHWPEASPGVMHLTLDELIVRQKITTRLRDAHKLATGGLRQRELFAMNALEEVLLWCHTQNPRAAQGRLDPRVQGVMDYLCAHLADKISLEGLARQCGLSPSRLSHLFRAQVGRPPQQFLEEQRLQRAQQMLDWTALPIGAIAADVGFDNPFYFTLRFKKQTGLSPRAWRGRRAALPLENETTP